MFTMMMMIKGPARSADLGMQAQVHGQEVCKAGYVLQDYFWVLDSEDIMDITGRV